MKQKYIYTMLAIVMLVIVGTILFLRSTSPTTSLAQREYTSTDTSSISSASTTPTVELQNGDTYILTMNYVKKYINGTEYRMLAYNGSIPGPLLKIAQGAEITIILKNDSDMDTLLHSHGIRMDNAFDGTQATQKEIKAGETFSYTLTFPDAGIYWYHPHVREDYTQELGLYGNYLVTPKNSDYWAPVNQEIALFLDDILIENGSISLSKKGADHTLMGRFGTVMLVNGETNYSLSAKSGETIRFYLTNSANARPFNFGIEGATLKLVGADSGAYEQDQWVDSVTLGPSERAIIEVLFEKKGTFAIQHKTPKNTYTLGTVVVTADFIDSSYATEFGQLREHTETRDSIDPFRKEFDRAPDKLLTLTLDMGGNMMTMPGMGHGTHIMDNGTMMGGSMMNPSEGGIEWEDDNQIMNQASDTDSVTWKLVDQVTGKENMDIDWVFTQGQPIKIRLFNDPNSMHPMQHPIHFHGQRFLVLDRNGTKETNLVWKDTVLIPSGETVDILLDTSNPGIWMAHCHIAEHLEAGMMFSFVIR